MKPNTDIGTVNLSNLGQRRYDWRALPHNTKLAVQLMRLVIFTLLVIFLLTIVINTVSLAALVGDATVERVTVPGYWFIIVTGSAIAIWGLTLLRDRYFFKGTAEITINPPVAKLIADDVGFYYLNDISLQSSAILAKSTGFARKLVMLPRVFYYIYTLSLVFAYPTYLWFVLNSIAEGSLPDLPNALYLAGAVILIGLYLLFFFGMLIPRRLPSISAAGE